MLVGAGSLTHFFTHSQSVNIFFAGAHVRWLTCNVEVYSHLYQTEFKYNFVDNNDINAKAKHLSTFGDRNCYYIS